MRDWSEFEPPSLCYFITPVVAAIGEAAADLGIGAAVDAGAAGAAALGTDAAITLPEVAVTAAAPAIGGGIAAGAGDAALAAGLGGAGDILASSLGGAGGAAGVAPTLPTSLAGNPPGGAASTLPPGASPLPVSPAASVGGPIAGSPAAPSGVVAASPPAAPGAGTFSDVISGTPTVPGDQLASADVGGAGIGGSPPITGATPASGGGGSVELGGAAGGGGGGGGGIPGIVSDTGALPSGAEGAVPGASGGAAAPASTNSFSQFLANPSLDTAGNILTKNPWALPAAGLGASVIMNSRGLPGDSQIKNEANTLNAQGQQLQNYLQTGTLPPGVQQGINQATQSAIASIKSRYAATGGSGSSAEQQDIANAQQVAESQGASIAMQLLNTGISESGMAAQLYQYISGQALSQDQALGSALSNFAASSIRPTVTLNTTAAP